MPNLNVANAIKYANQYATNPNSNVTSKNAYSYMSGRDCTNFATQILVAGGIKQEIYNDVSLGWWHKRTVDVQVSIMSGYTRYKSTYSTSWVNANTFSKRFGRTYYSYYRALAAMVETGDFIGFDEGKMVQ